jgi:hypothetical protein
LDLTRTWFRERTVFLEERKTKNEYKKRSGEVLVAASYGAKQKPQIPVSGG